MPASAEDERPDSESGPAVAVGDEGFGPLPSLPPFRSATEGCTGPGGDRAVVGPGFVRARADAPRLAHDRAREHRLGRKGARAEAPN